ncbi:YSIRK-type signal peptide-containing protein [Streptococcus uberis]|uniref:YSIRK-type signal peptide-containing protein n=1 Tax=Streptococcus uberis TaxID=1349 RepID=A0A6L6GAQ1_STRUB|nr:YSIRK-type signal peptide-containing protein [Streptococcus uberis]MTB35330.1 YSIRK-type signal peptide-containing protein [Streptococcus uberis]MTB37275.1 YSIRK-type signal peptide-containing protein [Streptococcus uberis]MTB54936.1 YSIRK-type signal peptide-containing protein [Streptococcus uberis]MTB60398.1 YSIRK-type signal peptide-containing protein [Streptococcus uberis]MTB77947.1 YSIRK-type signal peptide-containing protein [Streptococcus uberis]
MKKKQEMKYYLRKSAYGLAAVSVAVLAVGSPVSAQEKATETNVSGKEAPKVSKKPSKEIIEKVLKKAGEETKEKEKEAKEKVENSEESTAMVSELSSTNEETSSEEENNTDEEETDGLESEESEEEKEDDPSESDTEVENVEAINLSEAEGNDSSKPETSEEVTAEEDRQETDRLAEVKTEESAKEGDEDADKKDEVEEKAKKAAELSRVKAEALAKLEALNASRLMKKIVESGKTVEGILSFMKESLPQLEAARASEQAKAPEVTQSPDHLPSEKKAVHNPVQAVKTSESLEQKAENAKTSTNLQNTQIPVQEAKRTQAQLPSTGEDYQAYLVAAAMALIASSGMVAYGSYRKKKQK